MHWNGFIWVAWQWPPSQKNEAVWALFLSLLLLINDGIGRVSLGMREKGGVTGQGVRLVEPRGHVHMTSTLERGSPKIKQGTKSSDFCVCDKVKKS